MYCRQSHFGRGRQTIKGCGSVTHALLMIFILVVANVGRLESVASTVSLTEGQQWQRSTRHGCFQLHDETLELNSVLVEAHLDKAVEIWMVPPALGSSCGVAEKAKLSSVIRSGGRKKRPSLSAREGKDQVQASWQDRTSLHRNEKILRRRCQHCW